MSEESDYEGFFFFSSPTGRFCHHWRISRYVQPWTCHQVRQLCKSTWLALLRRDFLDKFRFADKSSPRSTYKLLHTIHQSEKENKQWKAMRELSQQFKTKEEQLDKVSVELRTTSQELDESQKTTKRLSERLQQTARPRMKASQAEKLYWIDWHRSQNSKTR